MKKHKSSSCRYQQVTYGTWGRFNTPAGAIEFLETKARLGSGSTDSESRLTRFLKPVREALPTKDMDFNQLLQRDLDDHRVATELVPYLLQSSNRGPAFFPPIVAALLPFEGKTPLEDFPEKTECELNEDDESYWLGYAFGEAFKFERSSYSNGSTQLLKVGKLSWNDERAKLVVIDGQHRAMALLAVFRTLDKWEGDGEKYKHFYEAAVLELLAEIPESERASLFAEIELPVTIVWFPELNSSQRSSHQRAARKLFVDVNKNARPPSPSRVLLLSDTNLSAILTRRVLNEFRNSGTETLPISAIEYDHPERDQAASAKWSAISNVSIIHMCILRAVFGPAKYINDLEARFTGKENVSEGAKFMQASLRLSNVIAATVDDGDRVVRREDISNTNFPRSELSTIEDQFAKSWAPLVVQMLSELKPYKAHGQALLELKNGWEGHDSTSRLASDSIFEGVGMYWTIRDSFEHWRDRNRIRSQAGQSSVAKTDIVKAWEETEKKREEFESLRAKHYLGATSNSALEASKGVYGVFATHACQLGFVLAVRSLTQLADIAFEATDGFIAALINGANAGLSGECPGDFGRLTFISRNAPNPLNRIPKLDSPEAVYFRYFWLELFGSKEARLHIVKVVAAPILDDAIKVSRRLYLNRLQDIFRPHLKNLHPEWNDFKLSNEASETAKNEFSKGLKKWFGVSAEDFATWLTSAESTAPTTTASQESPAEADATDEDSAPEDSFPTIDELITDD